MQRSPETLGLGPLEARIMRVLWKQGPSLGTEVHRALQPRRTAALAYTTVLNVLSNLEAKGVVSHVTEGRSYRFSPTLIEEALFARQAAGRTRALFQDFDDQAGSAILGEVRADPNLAQRFRQLLDEDDTYEAGRA